MLTTSGASRCADSSVSFCKTFFGVGKKKMAGQGGETPMSSPWHEARERLENKAADETHLQRIPAIAPCQRAPTQEEFV